MNCKQRKKERGGGARSTIRKRAKEVLKEKQKDKAKRGDG